MSIVVRVIRKYHDKNGTLLGYTIQDTTGKRMTVYKDQLKQAVMSGQVEVVNMTLTSDGRLIGKASKEPVFKKIDSKIQREKSGCKVAELYTNGRNIPGALIDKSEYYKMHGKSPEVIKGIAEGFGFESGIIAYKQIIRGYYDNIAATESKPDLSSIKKKSFKTIKPKLLKLLSDNNVETTLTVAKGDEKYEYKISIDNLESINNEEFIQIILCLIEDAMWSDKIKSLNVDNNSLVVSCLTGINDVRKATKKVFKLT